MAGDTTFKVDTTGSPYGVKIWRTDPGAKKIVLDFENDTETKTLVNGDYYVSVVFWGARNATFKLTITDPSGKSKTFPPLTIEAGEDFGHDLGRFSIPL